MNEKDEVVGAIEVAPWTFHAFYCKSGSTHDLGTLGGDWSEANAVNANGEIVGFSTLRPGSFARHAFLFREGKMMDLGTLGGVNSEAMGINDNGIVAGVSQMRNGAWHLCAFGNRSLRDLGTVPGDEIVKVVGINNQGDIAGVMMRRSGSITRGFLWHKGKLRDIGAPPRYTDVMPYAMNAEDEITGVATDVHAGQRRAFAYVHGVMQLLPDRGGGFSQGFAVSDAGVIVGECDTQDHSRHAFLFDGKAMRSLGAPEDSGSSALWINDSGQVVGTLDAVPARPLPFTHAALFTIGRTVDLNDMLRPRRDIQLTRAIRINARGTIVCEGKRNGHEATFLLVRSG